MLVPSSESRGVLPGVQNIVSLSMMPQEEIVGLSCESLAEIPLFIQLLAVDLIGLWDTTV